MKIGLGSTVRLFQLYLEAVRSHPLTSSNCFMQAFQLRSFPFRFITHPAIELVPPTRRWADHRPV